MLDPVRSLRVQARRFENHRKPKATRHTEALRAERGRTGGNHLWRGKSMISERIPRHALAAFHLALALAVAMAALSGCAGHGPSGSRGAAGDATSGASPGQVKEERRPGSAEPVGKPASSSCSSSDSERPGLGLSLVVGYYVVVDGREPAFFNRYCEETDVRVTRSPGGELRAGPFLSAYEASWLAGVTPHARVLECSPGGPQRDGFVPPDLDNRLEELGGDVRVARATEEAIAGVTIVEAIFRCSFGKVRGFYALIGNIFRHVADHPPMGDPYQSSFGLAVGGPSSAPIFFEVADYARGTGEKTEHLVAFRIGPEGEKLQIGEVLLTQYLQLAGETIDFTCTRLDSSSLTRYELSVEPPPAGMDTSLKHHDWDGWPAGRRQPDLVRLERVVRRVVEPIPWPMR